MKKLRYLVPVFLLMLPMGSAEVLSNVLGRLIDNKESDVSVQKEDTESHIKASLEEIESILTSPEAVSILQENTTCPSGARDMCGIGSDCHGLKIFLSRVCMGVLPTQMNMSASEVTSCSADCTLFLSNIRAKASELSIPLSCVHWINGIPESCLKSTGIPPPEVWEACPPRKGWNQLGAGQIETGNCEEIIPYSEPGQAMRYCLITGKYIENIENCTRHLPIETTTEAGLHMESLLTTALSRGSTIDPADQTSINNAASTTSDYLSESMGVLSTTAGIFEDNSQAIKYIATASVALGTVGIAFSIVSTALTYGQDSPELAYMKAMFDQVIEKLDEISDKIDDLSDQVALLEYTPTFNDIEVEMKLCGSLLQEWMDEEDDILNYGTRRQSFRSTCCEGSDTTRERLYYMEHFIEEYLEVQQDASNYEMNIYLENVGYVLGNAMEAAYFTTVCFESEDVGEDSGLRLEYIGEIYEEKLSELPDLYIVNNLEHEMRVIVSQTSNSDDCAFKAAEFFGEQFQNWNDGNTHVTALCWEKSYGYSKHGIYSTDPYEGHGSGLQIRAHDKFSIFVDWTYSYRSEAETSVFTTPIRAALLDYFSKCSNRLTLATSDARLRAIRTVISYYVRVRHVMYVKVGVYSYGNYGYWLRAKGGKNDHSYKYEEFRPYTTHCSDTLIYEQYYDLTYSWWDHGLLSATAKMERLGEYVDDLLKDDVHHEVYMQTNQFVDPKDCATRLRAPLETRMRAIKGSDDIYVTVYCWDRAVGYNNHAQDTLGDDVDAYYGGYHELRIADRYSVFVDWTSVYLTYSQSNSFRISIRTALLEHFENCDNRLSRAGSNSHIAALRSVMENYVAVRNVIYVKEGNDAWRDEGAYELHGSGGYNRHTLRYEVFSPYTCTASNGATYEEYYAIIYSWWGNGGYYATCGRANTCGNNDSFFAREDDTYRVRCCRDSNANGWEKSSSCPYDIWALSTFSEGCTNKFTHAQAVSICANNGGRLCTKNELNNDCTATTGCNSDFYLIWSSTEA